MQLPRCQHPRDRLLLPAWFVAFLVFLALFAVLAGCAAFQRKPPDPYAELRQSWRPGFTMSDAQLDALPAYSITVHIDPAEKRYTGTLDLRLPISSAAPLRQLYFRTYPNLYAFGGSLKLTGAHVNDRAVPFAPTADGVAVRLVLPEPLEPGTRAQVWLAFAGEVTRESKPGEYTIFGLNEDVLSLTNFYPILAARRTDGPALDVPHPRGDVGFHDAALYRVQVTVPAGQTLIATGTEITRTVDADGLLTARYVLGPAREFTVLLGRYDVMEVETLGTRVRSYFYPVDADAGKKALYDAVAALQIYSDVFGPYPYRDMAVVQAPLIYHGMEFPGLSLIGSQVYNRFTQDLENLVVHEVAHQWWYNQVGNDQVLTPWLDEGLTEFSMYMYYRGRYGEPVAERLRELRWAIPVADVARRGGDRPIGLPVIDYTENYETLIYGKGALFFAALRDELGPAQFETLLRTYLDRYRWQIATPAEFQALAEEVAGKDLDGLFNEWVYGK